LLTNNPTYIKAIANLNDIIEQEQAHWRHALQQRKEQERAAKLKRNK
jgi:hypothetical protein